MDPMLALFIAVATGDVQSVKALVAEHPELARAKNADGLSVLRFARYVGHEDILESLIDAGPPLDFFEAAQLGRTQVLASMLDADPALVGANSADGFTALHFAAYYGNSDTVGLLLERGADTEAVTTNFLTNMPIHAAAAGRHFENCRLLLEHGAHVNAQQHGGFTALHAAAQHGDRALAELFLSHGADASMATDESKTAPQIAAEQGNVELAALLRARTG
ncbi:MAG: ankyrin repeat domain-containing protein [Chloroflexota bacterium]|nr:ankyrin repeat domain-containing protein [Chloroflexota bacterium]